MKIIHKTDLSNECLLTVLANQTDAALIVIDEQEHIILFNLQAEKLLLITSQEALGLTLQELCKKTDTQNFLPNIIESIQSGIPVEEITSQIRNLHITWKLQQVDVDKHRFYLLKTLGKTEEKYRNMIYQFEILLENMPCNVYWVDKNSRMLGCNQNVLNMLNMTREEFKGKTYEELSLLCNWQEGLGEKLKNDDIRVMKTGIPIIGEEDPPIPHADGSFSNFLTSRVPLKNKDGEIVGIAGISMEITALKEARSKAEAANHAKTEFIANMSHDLRTPLSGIVGMSNLLEEAVPEPNLRQYAQWINDSGEQLLLLLNSILDMVSADNANEQDLHEEPFSLRSCLEGLIQLEKPSTKLKGLDLFLRCDEGIPDRLLGDRTKLHRILLNLLGNAVKFTEKGSICIDVSLIGASDDTVDLHFAVIDTGIGIPADCQDLVFDRFFRVNPSYKGTHAGHGVGLNIVQSYVRLLGGQVSLQSEENKGTTFSFNLSMKRDTSEITLPPLREELPVEEKKARQKLQKNRPKIHQYKTKEKTRHCHILLIEDNLIAREVAEQIILKAGCDITSAVDAESALDLLKKQRFDLIISDIGLPGMSGHDLCKKIRALERSKHTAETPVIGLSAHAKNHAEKEGLASGMNEVFTKPVNQSMMEKILHFLDPKCQKTILKESETIETANSISISDGEMFNLAQFQVLDPQYGLQMLNNNLSLLFDSLRNLISDSMPADMAALKEAYRTEDWDKVEHLAHKLKGGLIYCGAMKMKYACQYLEQNLQSGQSPLKDRLYQQLLDTAEETSLVVHDWLRKYNS